MTVEQKLALFRSLFRGREDVYPKLWVNTRDGRKGYAPACANEWLRGVCRKPDVITWRSRCSRAAWTSRASVRGDTAAARASSSMETCRGLTQIL